MTILVREDDDKPSTFEVSYFQTNSHMHIMLYQLTGVYLQHKDLEMERLARHVRRFPVVETSVNLRTPTKKNSNDPSFGNETMIHIM